MCSSDSLCKVIWLSLVGIMLTGCGGSSGSGSSSGNITPSSFAGIWKGFVGGSDITTFNILQSGTALTITSNNSTAGLSFGGVVDGNTATVTEKLNNSIFSTVTFTLANDTTVNGVVTSCTPPAGYTCGLPTGSTITLNRSPSVNVSTIAGSGYYGTADGQSTSASFQNTAGITTDGTNLYVSDSNKIRKIVISSGQVSTLAGSDTAGAVDGTGAAASFNNLNGITTDGSNLYVADTFNNTIRKIVISSGQVSTLAGSGAAGAADGIGSSASFNNLRGIATDGTSLYVADTGNHSIRRVVISSGQVSTIAGSGAIGSFDGMGILANFNGSIGIAVDASASNLYVADTGNHSIRRVVISSGQVSTIAGSQFRNYGSIDGTQATASFWSPKGIATDGTYLYVADTFNGTIRKVVLGSGEVFTIAGAAGGESNPVDGIGAAAGFNHPYGVVLSNGAIFLTDTYNNKLRKVQ